MRKILKVAQREYIETVSTRTFLLGVILTPLLIGSIMYFTSRDAPGPQLEKISGLMNAFFFMFLMFMGIFGTGQHMLSSIIEEKSSRVIEILLSALSPFQLMAGKILGLAGVGLTVISILCVTIYGGLLCMGTKVGIPLATMPLFVIYYVLGFMLFSSIFAAFGSVCNTIKEAQSLMMPVSMIMVVPMMAWVKLAQDPNGTLARVLSFVPPLTPMVMVLRKTVDPRLSSFEVVASMVLLAASVPATMWIAAKVFRTGILMYGKRPRLFEIVKWIRQS